MPTSEKPPYAVPSMAAICATPNSGLTHVSTFSGGGGSCLGFRLAGFQTVLAMDIDPQAVDTYRANLPSPILLGDIRQLTGAEVLSRIGLAPGELDVLEGSPPCTAFSTAGSLAAGWRETKIHAGTVQTNIEDLFFDWLRLVEEIRPRSFMAENVAGLVKGASKGYFKAILQQMKSLGYRTEARILDAQWLGVPQRRPRVIFIGIREDLQRSPAFPTPWSYQYSVRDVLPEILRMPETGPIHKAQPLATDVSPTVTTNGFDGWGRQMVQVIHDTRGQYSEGDITRKISPTITAKGSGQIKIQTATSQRRLTIDELKRLCSFPDDYIVTGSYSQQWKRLGNAVPPLMAYAIAAALREVLHARA